MTISRRRFLAAAAGAALGLPAAAAGYARFIEPRWLSLDRRDIFLGAARGDSENNRGAAGGGRRFRALHISDIHESDLVPASFIAEGFAAGLAFEPAAIFLTGDFVTDALNDPRAYRRALKTLTAAAPTFACLGNHDGGWRWAHYQDTRTVADFLGDAGVDVLADDIRLLSIGDSAVRVHNAARATASSPSPQNGGASSAVADYSPVTSSSADYPPFTSPPQAGGTEDTKSRRWETVSLTSPPQAGGIEGGPPSGEKPASGGKPANDGGAAQIALYGLSDLWVGRRRGTLADSIARAFAPTAETAAMQNTAARIVLGHNPDIKDEIADQEWDILLAGHTHGGQVRYPPFFNTPHGSVRDRRFLRGLHDWEGRQLYVNQGLGNIYGVRFACRPQVAILDFHF